MVTAAPVLWYICRCDFQIGFNDDELLEGNKTRQVVRHMKKCRLARHADFPPTPPQVKLERESDLEMRFEQVYALTAGFDSAQILKMIEEDDAYHT